MRKNHLFSKGAGKLDIHMLKNAIRLFSLVLGKERQVALGAFL